MDTCIGPDEVPDWQLEAFLDGAGTPATENHIMACAYCAQRLADLEDLTRRLEAALARVDCPSSDELRAHRWHQLPPDRAAEVLRHLASCAMCAREAASYAGPVPAEAATKGAQTAAAIRGIVSFVARLAPPSALQPAVRGPEAQTAIYQVSENGWEVMLDQAAEARGYALSGQLLGPEPAALESAQAMALADGLLVLEAEVDASGWFVLRPLAPGNYALWIETGDTRIQIPDIKVGLPT